MKLLLRLLAALLVATLVPARAVEGLHVYPPVPGLAASAHYQVRLRSAGDGAEWQSAFAFETACKTIEKKTDAYFDNISGIHFENISIAAPSVLGEPQILWGQGDARLRNLTFENLTLGGKLITDPAFFKTNEFVDGLILLPNKKP